MRIVSIEGHKACCEAKGVRRDVSLTLLLDQDLAIGDHVLIHVGYALQLVTQTEATAIWDLFDEITDSLDLADA